MSTKEDSAAGGSWAGMIAIVGFVLVVTTQVGNMILARALAGTVPPFTLAFFRWTIVAAGLAPFAVAEMRSGRLRFRGSALPILAAGFLGMFICGGPVYIAGMTTTAINIALIMSLSPIVVLLLSWVLGLERIGALQVLGTGLALIFALLIVTRGDPQALLGMRAAKGDLVMLMAMLGWSGYTLMQSRCVEPSPLWAVDHGSRLTATDLCNKIGTLQKVSETQQLRQLSWGTTDMLSGCTRCPPPLTPSLPEKRLESEATRIAAIKEIFDRAIGKAAQRVEGSIDVGISLELEQILREDDRGLPIYSAESEWHSGF